MIGSEPLTFLFLIWAKCF